MRDVGDIYYFSIFYLLFVRLIRVIVCETIFFDMCELI
jgi:hypothetical protein